MINRVISGFPKLASAKTRAFKRWIRYNFRQNYDCCEENLMLFTLLLLLVCHVSSMKMMNWSMETALSALDFRFFVMGAPSSVVENFKLSRMIGLANVASYCNFALNRQRTFNFSLEL